MSRREEILYLKHVDVEGPGTLADYFEGLGYQTCIKDLGCGQSLPDHPQDFAAVVCLGGPMNVYETEAFPFLSAENTFIQKTLDLQIPFLGICLGAQLLAKACGARVVRSPQSEFGFAPIELNAQGQKDPLFEGLSESFDVFHWHNDMFEIPLVGVLLAATDRCPHQAFRVGTNAYGLQFHVEITDESIRQWSAANFDLTQKAYADLQDTMLKEYSQCRETFHQDAQKMYANFHRVICNKTTLPAGAPLIEEQPSIES